MMHAVVASRNLAVALALLGGSAQTLAQESRPSPKAHLELAVSTKPEVLTTGERFDLLFEVTNRGNIPLYFYNEFSFGAGTLDYQVLDEKREIVKGNVTFDDGILYFLEGRTTENLVRLDPGDKLENERRYLRVSAFATSPGECELTVYYESPVDWELHEGVPVWNERSGPLVARIELVIMER